MTFSPLKSFRVRRYQKHADRTVELDPRVTCFVGPSATGKSSVLRALRTLCLGKPDGPAYVRNRSPDGFLLSLALGDGTKVQRRRGKGGGRMRLGKQEFATTAGKVPDAVQAVLGCTAANFQMQHDGSFWVDANPAQVGKELNDLTGLGLIDAVLQIAGKRQRDADAREKVLAEQVESARTEVRRLRWVPKAVAAKGDLDKRYKGIQFLEAEIADLEALRTRLTAPVPDLPDIAELQATRAAADKLAVEEAELRQGLERITDLDKEIRCLQKESARLEKALARHVGRPCPTCGQRIRRNPAHRSACSHRICT